MLMNFFRYFLIGCVFVAGSLIASRLPAQGGRTPRASEGPVEPYSVYVARDDEHTRCGPAGEYYKADPLAAGDKLEVYLETNDGWLGIRPPDHSFCWLQSDQVEVADDQATGTIIEPSAVAWIGTHLGKARQYRWQVRLQQGEQVAIIGTARREGPEGEEVWYRIVPPAGEFRWVHRSQVVDKLSQVVFSRDADADETLLVESAGRRSRSTPPQPPGENTNLPSGDSAEADTLASNLDSEPIGSGVALAKSLPEKIAAWTGRNSNDPEKLAAKDASVWVSPAGATLPSSDVVSDVVPANAVSPVSPPADARSSNRDDNLLTNRQQNRVLAPLPRPSGYSVPIDLPQADIEALRTELSRAMASGASYSETEPLRERTLQLQSGATDSILRGRAALLLKRIEEYQRVAIQRDGADGFTQTASSYNAAQPLNSLDTFNPTTSPAIEQGITQTIATEASSGERTQFDRQGYLVKVYSARPSAPPYAITDTAGRTLCYVTPVPGINLRRYLNQEVGLYGRMAFDTSLETPHLIAEQAVRISRPVR